ncbi:cupin domain-containing protein [Microbacterium sp. zg-YB36]|uniref:cupin domain-containing protein n=1 Tax=Microbacterium sp. zg-YB36 TaxID=2969407 RepID=UPI00214C418B|nr:cupin domain-containing protein [Microbacterium sp. zg-YB36]MDL5351739.1 cupin domain-containing protein [Microbacterium sp. zg-YB36]
MTAPLFPGGVALSDLAVYDWEAADGCRGGSPHLHTASSEGYVVVGGSGAVHTLSSRGAEEHALAAGDVVWFSPGTVHRLVNDGDLRLLVVMSNAGLPEAGDAVLTFPADVLDDPDAYAAAATLPAGEGRADAARARRDLALHGYEQLRAAVRAEGPAALAALHARAARLVQSRVAGWTATWEATVAAETERTRAQLAALAAGEPGTLAAASVARADATPGERGYGMCGRLQTWRWPAG